MAKPSDNRTPKQLRADSKQACFKTLTRGAAPLDDKVRLTDLWERWARTERMPTLALTETKQDLTIVMEEGSTYFMRFGSPSGRKKEIITPLPQQSEWGKDMQANGLESVCSYHFSNGEHLEIFASSDLAQRSGRKLSIPRTNLAANTRILVLTDLANEDLTAYFKMLSEHLPTDGVAVYLDSLDPENKVYRYDHESFQAAHPHESAAEQIARSLSR